MKLDLKIGDTIIIDMYIGKDIVKTYIEIILSIKNFENNVTLYNCTNKSLSLFSIFYNNDTDSWNIYYDKETGLFNAETYVTYWDIGFEVRKAKYEEIIE